MANRRRNGTSNGTRNGRGRGKTNGDVEYAWQVELSDEEIRILVDACTMLRRSLPVYLMSSKPELQLIDRVIRKLS